MKGFKAAIAIGLLVAAGIAIFEWSAPESGTRSLLVYPLFPGYTVGFFLTQLGARKPVAYFSAWFANSAVFWCLWKILDWLFSKTAPTRSQSPD